MKSVLILEDEEKLLQSLSSGINLALYLQILEKEKKSCSLKITSNDEAGYLLY